MEMNGAYLEALHVDAQNGDNERHLQEKVHYERHDGKDAELFDCTYADEERDGTEQGDIGQSGHHDGPSDVAETMGNTRGHRKRQRSVDDGVRHDKHVFGSNDKDDERKKLPRDQRQTDAKQGADADTCNHTDDDLGEARKGHTKARVYLAHLDEATRNVGQGERIPREKENVTAIPRRVWLTRGETKDELVRDSLLRGHKANLARSDAAKQFEPSCMELGDGCALRSRLFERRMPCLVSTRLIILGNEKESECEVFGARELLEQVPTASKGGLDGKGHSLRRAVET